MKKLMIAMGLAALCASVQAIESANIVGYSTQTLEGGKWYLVGSAFEGTTGANLTIDSLFSGLTPNSDAASAPTIQYWNGTKLVSISYSDFVWSDDAGDFITAWADSEGTLVTLEAAPGFSCWMKVPETTTITTAGQVVSTNEKEISVTTGWSLVGNPYPTTLNLNDSNQVDCSNLTASSDNATTIQYWDGTKLVSISYSDFVWSDDAGDFVTAWADSEGSMFAVPMNPCTGFWIKGVSAGEKIIFKK